MSSIYIYIYIVYLCHELYLTLISFVFCDKINYFKKLKKKGKDGRKVKKAAVVIVAVVIGGISGILLLCCCIYARRYKKGVVYKSHSFG